MNFTFEIPSGTVNSNLTNFPVVVKLSHMRMDFWNSSNIRSDGGNIRVKTTGGTVIPHDLVRFDFIAQDGILIFLAASVLAASDNNWHIVLESLATEKLGVGDANGRNAVWAAYEAVYMYGETGGDDRTGNNSMGRVYNDPQLFEITATSSSDLNSHQGICFDGNYYYTTDTNKIYKWNSSWTLINSNTDPIGDTNITGTPTVNHCGDPDIYDGKLYIPIECYPYNGGYNGHIAVFNASDLSFIESFDISTQAHESSSIAYCEKDDYLYITDYDGNNTSIYKYDPSDGSYIGVLTTDKSIPERQGITWWRENFWVSQDVNDEVLRVSYTGTVSTGNLSGSSGGLFGKSITGSQEGIGKRQDELLLLADPGAVERVDLWKPLDINMGAGGGFYNSGTGHMRCGVGTLTTFTIGCTVIFDSLGQNRAFVSYWDESSGTSNSFRVTLAFSNTNSSFGVWDTNNSWLLCNPAINPSVDTPYRVNIVYSGTSYRNIQINAGNKNTDTTITIAPANRDLLAVAIEDESQNEAFVGFLGFLYLYNGILSDDWIQAEYDMLSDPSSFYEVEEDAPSFFLLF